MSQLVKIRISASFLLRAHKRRAKSAYMTQTLRTFLDQREADIKDQLKKLKQELCDIRKARDALASDLKEDSGNLRSSANRSSKVTIKDMIRTVLQEERHGLHANEIIEKIKQSFNKDIGRPSLSPQLSRLKQEKLITFLNDAWILPKFMPVLNLEETGATEVAPEAEEASTSSDEIYDVLGRHNLEF
ncbi:hypothetical protein [Acetobacter sp. UBA5411]|uniref:hypothetical protein n=1 Tax=Acetobacter sp. UBA5411 TaxID=1945905 RepID=UPI0025BF3D97|nr:hypothetical protein [Acetobacter sp. UBA5411]